MDPITSLVTGHASGKLIDRISTAFRTNVIERWTRRRANQFFDQFCREVELEMSGHRSDELDHLFEQMLEDEHASELLFDAYRRVSLSRSKTIGPRFIGVLTAQLALGNREPSSAEESMLFAAEELDDDELLSFARFVAETRQQLADDSNTDVSIDRGIVRIKWMEERFESYWNTPADTSISPLNFHDSHGSWAVKMSTRDILRTDITERTEYLEMETGRQSTRYVSFWVVTSDTYFPFADIISRVAEHRDITM